MLPEPEHDDPTLPPVVNKMIRMSDRVLESDRNSNILIIVLILLSLIPALGVGILTTRAIAPHTLSTATGALVTGGITANFSCARAAAIVAVFTESRVHLSLSDGRELTLPQALSASGARYANPDESFVFWNKGNTAFIEESGITTYENCTTLS